MPSFLWCRHQAKLFFALLVLCEGNQPVTGGFPTQRPVMRSFEVFIDQPLNKRLSKQSRRPWSETPWRSLWSHCNVYNLHRIMIPLTKGMPPKDAAIVDKPPTAVMVPSAFWRTGVGNSSVTKQICTQTQQMPQPRMNILTSVTAKSRSAKNKVSII